jgi:uncharacterized membrane protein
MPHQNHHTVTCQVCHQAKPFSQLLAGELVRPALEELIRAEFPNWDPMGYICLDDLNRFRGAYVQHVISSEKGELSDLEEQVIRSLARQELQSRDLNREFAQQLSLADRLSDALAAFGGSWGFIGAFFVAMALWMTINIFPFIEAPFDPYPFILLNLVLSCLAAIQAPIIMMSQNRQEARDRMRAEHDYRVNLQAELEIRHLHSKMDVLLHNLWQRLLEIQQIQTDLMSELATKRPRG